MNDYEILDDLFGTAFANIEESRAIPASHTLVLTKEMAQKIKPKLPDCPTTIPLAKWKDYFRVDVMKMKSQLSDSNYAIWLKRSATTEGIAVKKAKLPAGAKIYEGETLIFVK